MSPRKRNTATGQTEPQTAPTVPVQPATTPAQPRRESRAPPGESEPEDDMPEQGQTLAPGENPEDVADDVDSPLDEEGEDEEDEPDFMLCPACGNEVEVRDDGYCPTPDCGEVLDIFKAQEAAYQRANEHIMDKVQDFALIVQTVPAQMRIDPTKVPGQYVIRETAPAQFKIMVHPAIITGLLWLGTIMHYNGEDLASWAAIAPGMLLESKERYEAAMAELPDGVDAPGDFPPAGPVPSELHIKTMIGNMLEDPEVRALIEERLAEINARQPQEPEPESTEGEGEDAVEGEESQEPEPRVLLLRKSVGNRIRTQRQGGIGIATGSEAVADPTVYGVQMAPGAPANATPQMDDDVRTKEDKRRDPPAEMTQDQDVPETPEGGDIPDGSDEGEDDGGDGGDDGESAKSDK
ncbi:MAG: hypothetical protein V2A76_16855 [Planctomycetota bacterium]